MKSTQRQLLLAAERLMAERGIEAVSTREIAREAGARNHSSVTYHFGSKEALVRAILDFRAQAINDRAEALLAALEETGNTADIRNLVAVLVLPPAEELKSSGRENNYIGFLAQLTATLAGRQILVDTMSEAPAIRRVQAYLVSALAELGIPERVYVARVDLLSAQLPIAISLWDQRNRQGSPSYAPEHFPWLTQNLIDALSASLTAPVSELTTQRLDAL